jgi:hypothetical protein
MVETRASRVASTINSLVAMGRDRSTGESWRSRKLRSGSVLATDVTPYHRLPHQLEDVDGVHDVPGVAPIPNAADDAGARPAPARPQPGAAAGAVGRPEAMRPSQHPANRPLHKVMKLELEPWLGRTLADLVEARGHPSDVLADWLPNDLRHVLVVGSLTATSTTSPRCSSIPTR